MPGWGFQREGLGRGGLARRLPLPLLRGAGGGLIMPQGLRGDPSRKPGGLPLFFVLSLALALASIITHASRCHSRSFSLGWHLLCTSFKSVMLTCAYTYVDSSEWPSSSWMCLMFALFLSMSVAHVCRKVCGEMFF